MSGIEDERGGVVAHLLVLVERHLQPLGAGWICALAEELGIVGLAAVEPLGCLGDPLVDVPKQ